MIKLSLTTIKINDLVILFKDTFNRDFLCGKIYKVKRIGLIMCDVEDERTNEVYTVLIDEIKLYLTSAIDLMIKNI